MFNTLFVRTRILRVAVPLSLALVMVAVLSTVSGPAPEASAAEREESFVDHQGLVPEIPRRDLPVVLNPTDPQNGQANLATLTTDMIDGFIISGGNFEFLRQSNGQILRQPHLLIWDDLNSEIRCQGLIPDREVLAVAAGPDPATLIIAGRFNTITDANGVTVTRRKIAKIDLDSCTVDTAWAVPAPNSRISELAVIDDRLFVGGNFTALGATPLANVAEVSLQDGTVNSNFSFSFVADLNRTVVVGMDVHPNGSRLGIVHKALTVDGIDQRGTAIFDISNRNAPTLTNHRLAETSIPWRYNFLIQDGGFSPDFSRVIIANGTVLEADQITLARTTEAPGQFEWTKNMWDTTFAIDISNNAVYAGGHFCRIDAGPGATDLLSPNGLDECTGVQFGGTAWRSQLAALSLVDGTPLAWNPGSNAFKGVVSLKVVSRGLLIGQDGSRINSFTVGTTAFLDFGNARDDRSAPEIENATTTMVGSELQVAGTVVDDVRGKSAFVTVRHVDGRFVQANGTLGAAAHRFTLPLGVDGKFANDIALPSGTFNVRIDAADHTGKNASAVTSQVVVDGQAPAAGECVATSNGGQVDLRWAAFNGEDDGYSVRDANGWVATVAPAQLSWSGPAGTYVIRSREGGRTVNVACTGAAVNPNPNPGPNPANPQCRATPNGGTVQIEWDVFNNEDDKYQVRDANGWLATVDAGQRNAVVAAELPVTILSREGGQTATLVCN